MQDGKDSRFDEIKKSPPKFLVAFMAQATWISLCLMPILAVNSIPHAVLSTLPAIGITDVLGLLLYAGGLGFEVTADRQKDAWVQSKKKKVSLLSCQLLIHLFGSSEPGSFL
jgi:steroid 5-alpha reductase family enzyme